MSFDALVSRSERDIGLDSLSEEQRRELDQLERLFTVDAARLKSVSKRFEEELQEGLDADGGNIPMNIAWVFGFPDGNERGNYLTTDLGGTNLRVCWVELKGRGNTQMTQESYRLPDELKTGDAESLWGFIADSLGQFIKDQKLHQEGDEPLPLGFTFSYPATQKSIDHGILQTWTKGFDVKGVEGKDVVAQLRSVLEKKNIPAKIVALVNDTVGAMIASAYNDPDTIIGAIFGTGCNGAYMENCGSISKLEAEFPADQHMAINCEYGAFDNSLRVLPRTAYDETIDAESPRPGEQAFEKMSAGLYLGEIFRLVILHLLEKGVLFQGQSITKIKEPYSFDTSYLSRIETDHVDFRTTKHIIREQLGLSATTAELAFCYSVANLIGVRSARLCACGIAAICSKKGIKSGHVAADGSVANRHPEFKARWSQAIGEILDWPADRGEDPIVITSAEDGSGFGAAVIAAMTLRRAEKRGCRRC